MHTFTRNINTQTKQHIVALFECYTLLGSRIYTCSSVFPLYVSYWQFQHYIRRCFIVVPDITLCSFPAYSTLHTTMHLADCLIALYNPGYITIHIINLVLKWETRTNRLEN